MQRTQLRYGLKKEVSLPFDEAYERVRGALGDEGFGVLTEIDVKETLKNKLDVEFRPYKILGACNPPLAYKALTTDPDIGLLLPCNVVVQETESGVRVSIVKPKAMFSVVGDPRLDEVVKDVDSRMQKILDALS